MSKQTKREAMVVLHVRVPRDLEERLKQMAREGDRTLSWLVRKALEQAAS